MKSVLIAALLVLSTSMMSFAQIYVNNTNGDDLVGQGTQLSSYRTIAKAVQVASAGTTIYVASDVYNEGNLVIDKALTFVATPFNGLTTVTITNGITVNTANASDVVNFALTGEKFNLGTTATALVLTKGNLRITTANVIIGSGGRITRTAGTLDNSPTVSNVNVVYGSQDNVTAGGETPANIGSGSLTLNVLAGKTVTFPGAITTTGGITINTGNATFNGNLNLSSSSFVNVPAGNTISVAGNMNFTSGVLDNQNTGTITVGGSLAWTVNANIGDAIDNGGNGTITINGTVNFAKFTGTGAVAGDHTASIYNHGTGTLTLAQGFTTTPGTVSNASRKIFVSATNNAGGEIVFGGAVTLDDLTNTAAGKITLAGGTVLDDVSNAAGGTIELTASTTFADDFSNGNAGSVVKLNSNTLTLSAADGAATVTNTGKIISATAATVGSGVVAITGTAVTINGGELPNVTIATGKALTTTATNVYGSVTNAGTFTFNAALTIEGDLTNTKDVVLGQNLTLKGNYSQTAGTLALGARTFEVRGNWVRSSNVPGDVTYTTGVLSFRGGNAQTFTPGASLNLYDVEVNKTAGTVTLAQSLEVYNNFTITAGGFDLGDYNIRMKGATGTFTNSGNYYSTSGNGYLIFEGAAAAYNLSGAGVYSNMDIRGGATVTATSNINFSGNLILRNGVLAVGANTFTFSNDLVAIPSITRHTGTGSMTVGAGTITREAGVVYNLTYIGDASAVAAAEWLGSGLNNLTIATGDGAADPSNRTVTGPASANTISGALTVNLDQTLNLNGQDMTFASDAVTHTVVGTVSNGNLIVTGNNVVLNGSSSDAATATISNLQLSTSASESFTSNNLKVISGNLTVDNGTANITMNAKDGTINGNVLLTAGTLNLVIASNTTNVMGGNVTLVAGTLTLTRGSVAARQTITGNVVLTGGTLVLGSDVNVSGATSIVAGNLNLASFNYTQTGSVAANDFDRTGAGVVSGTGKIIFDAAAALTINPGASFTLANVEFKGALGNTISAPMTVSGTLVHTAGALALNTLTFSGSAYTYTAGTYTGTLVLTGTSTVTASGDMTVPNVTLNTDGTVTFASNNTTKRTLFVSTDLTLTKGTLAMGSNDLEVQAAWTRTAGNISQGTGFLIVNTAAAPSIGDNFAIDNMKVAQSVDFGTKAFSVNKNLVLASGTLTTSADGKLSLGNGLTIERQAAGATLSKVPAFGTGINVLYSTAAGAINTAKELPATVNDLTVNMPAGGSVVLTADVTVNGTLSLNRLLDATTTANVEVTMANNSTLELKADGTTVLDENLTKAGTLNIVYNGAANTTTRELGPTTSATTHTAGNVTFKSLVALDANATFTGTVTFNGANMNLAGNTLYVQGDITEAGAGGFFVPAAASNLIFNGNTNQVITLLAERDIHANLNVTLSKTNGTNTVTLTGGNLDFAANNQLLTFVNGVLVTGNNIVKLDAPTFGNGQGFDRSGVTGSKISHVVGNVNKTLLNGGTITTSTEPRSEFPVGSLTMYRPVSLTFNATSAGVVTIPNTTLTVAHVDAAPTGTVGLPIANGVEAGKDVSRYPEFYWSILSSVNVSTGKAFDLELGAAGFDQFDDVNNIRTIRRHGSIGDVTNQWLLQGTAVSYDNEVNNGAATIIAQGSTGGLRTGGAVFTLGLSSALTVVNPVAAQTLTSNGAVKDINLASPQVFGGNTGVLTYIAQSSNNTVAEVAISGSTLSITPKAVGNAVISLTATDANNDFLTTQFNVTVNPVTQFAVSGQVTYNNNASTPLAGVTVTLNPGGATTVTDANGNYGFANIANGAYTITAATTTNWPSQAVNATDAQRVAQHYANISALTGLPLVAADVNNNSSVNNTDALQIIRRWAGLITSFAKGDWSFNTVAVTVNGAAITNAHIKGIAVGDAKGDWNGTLNKAVSTTLAMDGVLKVNPKDEFEVAVKAGSDMNIGAMSLRFTYPADLVTFESVTSNANGIVTGIKDGVVSIGWADVEALNLKANAPVVTLKFKPTESFKAGSKFDLTLDASSELANKNGEVISSAMLKSASVEAFVPAEFALKQNYPNPFNPSTTIAYDLPVDSKVSLVVFNAIGQEVATLVNEVQAPGVYKYDFNASRLTSGVYYYRINVSAGEKNFTQTQKMVLMK